MQWQRLASDRVIRNKQGLTGTIGETVRAGGCGVRGALRGLPNDDETSSLPSATPRREAAAFSFRIVILCVKEL